MNWRTRAARIRADVAFLLARLLFGVGAYVLLGVGLAGVIAVVVAIGFLTVFVLPWAAAALVTAWIVAELLRLRSAVVRHWLARRPFRRGIRHGVTAVGRGLAAVTVWWLLACRASARRERAHAAEFRDEDIPMTYRPLPEGRLPMLRIMVSDPATWRDLTYLAVMPIYALLACVAIVAMWGGAIALLASAPGEVRPEAPWTDPVPWLTVTAAVGALVVAPFATQTLAHGAATLAAALLATGEGARMRAELDEQRLQRRMAVDAAERERRRIERDLHDGAQQRLVALGMTLGMARETLPEDPVAGAALVAEAHAEAKLALTELRDLARGIHPAILGDRGLDAALSELLRRTQLPVSIMVALPRRPPTSVESAAYFVVAEALTNISRHADATRATVSVREADGVLKVEICDDGVGGADPSAGTGLSGLAERVAALGGRFTVNSPEQGPTTIRAELPCAS